MSIDYAKRRKTNGTMLKIAAVAVLLGALVILGKAMSPDEPDTPKAFSYKVIDSKMEKRHAINRTRLRLSIAPDGPVEYTFASLGDTAIRAALDAAEETGADVIFVTLHQTEKTARLGFIQSLASATYVPDGKGIGGNDDLTWDVRAADHAIPDVAINMQILWYRFRGDFQKDGMTDEPKLSAYLARELDTSVDAIGDIMVQGAVFPNKYLRR